VQRISDLDTVRTSINLFLTSVAGPDLDDAFATAAGVGCNGDWWSSTSATLAASQPFTNPATAENSQTLTTPRDVNGEGWVAIDFGGLSTGAPVPNLPVDPAPLAGTLWTTGRFYAYQCENTNKLYELNANMESTKYSTAATGPEDDDGGICAGVGVACTLGNANLIYEVGNDPGLNL
jgi:hypothetical protein